MSTKIRCFAIDGMIASRVSSDSGRRADNALWLAKLPYLARETLTAGETSVTSDLPLSENEHSNLLMVEVEGAKRVRYEVSTRNIDVRPATQDSPVLYGETIIAFGTGYRISFIEDAG